MDTQQEKFATSGQETRPDFGEGPVVEAVQADQGPSEHAIQPEIVREDPENDKYDDNEDKKDSEGEKKGGRRKINIEFIENKSRRHVTFSKRKAGLIKKAYELSTLTGTQVLLLVASETGNVYTFATPKLQPLITKPEGKTLIQACLNPPEVAEISSHQQQSSSILHQQRLPSESHNLNVYQEKKAPSTYQTKEGNLQNMWAPLQSVQDRMISKEPRANTDIGGSYGGYSTVSSSTSGLAQVPSSYSQYNNYGTLGLGNVGSYHNNSIPRYQYATPTGNYNQFGSPTQQNSQYSGHQPQSSNSFMYTSPSVGSISAVAPFNSNTTMEGSSSITPKDPIV